MRNQTEQTAGIQGILLRRLEGWLSAYDRVFLIPSEAGSDPYVSGVFDAAGTFAQEVLHAAGGMAGERKFLLLSAAPLGDIPGFTREQVTGEEEGLLLRLYHMYEFSDHFSVIMEESGHGGLYHLVDTGLLSVGEAAQALFS